MNLDILFPPKYRPMILILRSSTSRDCVQRLTVTFRPLGSKLRRNSQSCAPILTPCGGLSHNRLDSERTEGLRYFLHFSRPSFTMQNDAADHVVGKTLPVDPRKTLRERGKHAFIRPIWAGRQDAFE